MGTRFLRRTKVAIYHTTISKIRAVFKKLFPFSCVFLLVCFENVSLSFLYELYCPYFKNYTIY